MPTFNQTQFNIIKERTHVRLMMMVANHKELWRPTVNAFLGDIAQFTALSNAGELRRTKDIIYANTVAQMLINSKGADDVLGVGYIHQVWNEIDEAVEIVQNEAMRLM